MRNYKMILLISIFTLTVSMGSDSFAENPTQLTCMPNAKVTRDYGFREKIWMGSLDDYSIPFRTKINPTKENDPYYRIRVFADLYSSTPIIKTVWPKTKLLDEQVEIYKGTVVSRTSDSVFIVWNNTPNNKAWLAVVNLKLKKAVTSILFEGITSVGFKSVTFDCN